MSFFKIVKLIITDTIYTFKLFIENNLRNFANIMELILPYFMYWTGIYNFQKNDDIIATQLFTPIIVFIIIYIIRTYANKIGKGNTVPVPEKRFTEIDEDGEVSIENSRVQELILYMADLEDWLERKNML